MVQDARGGGRRTSLDGRSKACRATAPRSRSTSTASNPTAPQGRFQAHAGTRWFQVIRALDPIGFSPAVMQSNSDFGIASTFSVNAHGWPVPYGPFGSTVRKIEMMLADGSVVTCSRRENADLFKLAMGGYGLFGVILKLEVEMVGERTAAADTRAHSFLALCRTLHGCRQGSRREDALRPLSSTSRSPTSSRTASSSAIAPLRASPSGSPTFRDDPAFLSRRVFAGNSNPRRESACAGLRRACSIPASARASRRATR